MKRERGCLIGLLVLSLIAIHVGGALAQQAGPVAAFVFPYDIVAEDYVPPLYYAEATMDETLVAVADFPTDT